MVFLRAVTVMTALGGAKGATPRSALDANSGLQVFGRGGMFWSKKALILRNAPYTINNPHLGQIEARLNFADVASRTKGQRGFSAEGLPKPASIIKQEISGYRAPDRLSPESYPSSIHRTLHTAAELRTMLERRRAGRAVELR